MLKKKYLENVLKQVPSVNSVRMILLNKKIVIN